MMFFKRKLRLSCWLCLSLTVLSTVPVFGKNTDISVTDAGGEELKSITFKAALFKSLLTSSTWDRGLSDEQLLNLTKVLADPSLSQASFVEPEMAELLRFCKNKDFIEAMLYFDQAINSLGADERKQRIIYSYRELFIDEAMNAMLERSKRKAVASKFKLAWSLRGRYETNISRAPNNETEVSEKEGWSSIGRLKLSQGFGRGFRHQGVLKFGFQHYLDSDPIISNRNSRYGSLAFKFALPDIKSVKHQLSYGYRADFTEATGEMKNTFNSHNLSSSLRFKSKKSSLSWIDGWFPMLKFDLGHRSFPDQNDKDTVVTAFNVIALAKGKYRSHVNTWTGLVRCANQASDSAGQEFVSTMFLLSFQTENDDLQGKVSLNYQSRHQNHTSDFNPAERRDGKWTAGFELAEKKFKGLRASLHYDFIYQDSTIDSFAYDNHVLSFQVKSR